MEVSAGVITATAVIVSLIAIVVIVLAAVAMSKSYSYLDTVDASSLVTLDEWNQAEGWAAKRDSVKTYMFWTISLLLLAALLSHIVIYAFHGAATTAACAVITVLVFVMFYYFAYLIGKVGDDAAAAGDSEIDINRALFSCANLWLVYSFIAAIALAVFALWKAYSKRTYGAKSITGRGVSGAGVPAMQSVARGIWS